MSAGRPEKTKQEKRNEILRTRLTLAERIHAEDLANEANISMSEMLRVLILTSEIKPKKTKLEASFLVELNRIGVNINQLSHAANIGRVHPESIETALNELKQLMQKIGNTL